MKACLEDCGRGSPRGNDLNGLSGDETRQQVMKSGFRMWRICGNKRGGEHRHVFQQLAVYYLSRRAPVPLANTRAVPGLILLRIARVLGDPSLGPLDCQADGGDRVENQE